MGQFIRDLLLIDLFIELIQRLFGLFVIAAIILIILALLGGQCFGSLCVPRIVDLGNIFGGILGRAAQPPPGEAECPQFQSAFPQLLPDTWTLQHVQAINIDGDDEKECVAVYQYDNGAGAYGGPLGGVIYDPQPDRDPRNMERRNPYRPAAYIPYHLLPREDGKGFLSERAPNWGQMIQVYDADGDSVDELVFQGFSGYSFPTYLSIFEWENDQAGYRLMTGFPAGATGGGPLFGDAGIEIQRETTTDSQGNEVQGQIQQVIVKNRPTQPFWYFRSQLCYATIYRWNQARTALEPDDYYLTFCFGRPDGVQTRQDNYALWYPEEALLAWYEDGEVKEIEIPRHPVGDTLQATVKLRQNSQQRWLATWMLRESTDSKVANMTYWHLEMVGQPYDP